MSSWLDKCRPPLPVAHHVPSVPGSAMPPQLRDARRRPRVDVKDSPFLVEKLGARVLPCVIGFIDGQSVGRVVGFEGLI